MNQTANYQLNQWESTDRILMSDFNSDNAKIDAALKAQAEAISEEAAARTAAVGVKADASALTAEVSARQAADEALAEKAGLQLIQQFQLTANDGFVEQALALDWGQWATVWLHLRPKFQNLTSYDVYLYNGTAVYLGRDVLGDLCVQLYPMFDATSHATGHTWTGGSVFSSVPFQNLEKLCMEFRNSELLAGSSLTVWGSK